MKGATNTGKGLRLSRLHVLESAQNRLDTKLQVLESAQNRLDTKLQVLESAQKGLDTKLQVFESAKIDCTRNCRCSSHRKTGWSLNTARHVLESTTGNVGRQTI